MIVNPSILRGRTERTLKERREQFGDMHPATFAAYARAHVAWEGRIKPPRVEFTPEMASAYTTADLRARGAAGFRNRHKRAKRSRDGDPRRYFA